MMLSSSSCRLKNHPWSAFIFASALSWMVIDHEIHVNQVRSDSEALWPWSAAAASAVAAIPAATAAGAAAGSSASAAAAPRSQVPVLVFYALGFNTMNTMNHKVSSKILQIYHLSLFEAHWRALDREYCRLQPEEFINFLNIDICVDAKWRHSKSKMQLDSRQLDTQSVKQITTMGFHST